MDLKKLTEESLKIFEVESIEELSDKIMQICINNKKEYFKEFKDLVQDLETDWLQKIFQYYEADRKEKKQDYTPKTLAELVAKLSQQKEEETVIDMCAGSGALTIQKWKTNKKLKFICQEYDEKVIPYLLFNLMLRNIEAEVQQIDVLENAIFHKYKIVPKEEFSECEVIK